MSEQDKRIKYNKNSNIDSSMYARVNAGGNAKFDVLNKQRKKTKLFFHTLLFYTLGFCISIALIFSGLWIFSDHFYGVGMNQLMPALMLLIVSFVVGFFQFKINHKKKHIITERFI